MKQDELQQAKENFIQGMSRISNFWGFPKAMGAIYGAIYLSPDPISLDAIVAQVGVTKGAVSTNVRLLERLGMVHKQIKLGDRKDYYLAEADFWKIVRGVMQEREKSEFALALQTVDDSLQIVKNGDIPPEQADLAVFYRERMGSMRSFFNSLDNLVATFVAFENMRMGTFQQLFKKAANEEK